jgi:hypothetical protein
MIRPLHPRVYVLARQPMARTWFRAMTSRGPACTGKLHEAAKFASKADALASRAVTDGGDWIFAAVEVK